MLISKNLDSFEAVPELLRPIYCLMIKSSELILNPDGSVFHLRLLPEQIAKTIILVGDQDRVGMISSHFDKIDVTVQNREFITHTGTYRGEKITVLSTGIGTDNIDIVVNELDALVNINMENRKPKTQLTPLNLIRLGTSGSIQPDIPLGTILLSEKAIGFDGLLNYYKRCDEVSDLALGSAFMKYVSWDMNLPKPYVVSSDQKLLNRFAGEEVTTGITISASGFYGPQGRVMRLALAHPELNQKIAQFRFGTKKVTNFEMESSAIYGLASLLGHRAVTLCAIIANRSTGEFMGDYKNLIQRLIVFTLNRIAGKQE